MPSSPANTSMNGRISYVLQPTKKSASNIGATTPTVARRLHMVYERTFVCQGDMSVRKQREAEPDYCSTGAGGTGGVTTGGASVVPAPPRVSGLGHGRNSHPSSTRSPSWRLTAARCRSSPLAFLADGGATAEGPGAAAGEDAGAEPACPHSCAVASANAIRGRTTSFLSDSPINRLLFFFGQLAKPGV